MRVISWDELLPLPDGRGRAAAVGVFDGLHQGHQKLLRRVIALRNLESCVLTFNQNPKIFLGRAKAGSALFSHGQKLRVLEELGLETCVLIDFSGDFSTLPGRRFLSLLSVKAGIRRLVLGSDFRCGKDLDCGAEDLRSFGTGLGMDTEIMEPLLYEGSPISSSRIRDAVAEARLEDAAAMLGRPYSLDFSGIGSRVTARGLALSGSGLQIEPPPGRYEAQARLGPDFFRCTAVFEGSRCFLEMPGLRRIDELALFRKSL